MIVILGEVKTLMVQLLRGVAHLHDNWIIHRDLKTSNLLFSHKGILKVRRKTAALICHFKSQLFLILDRRFRSCARVRFSFETVHADRGDFGGTARPNCSSDAK